jgi:preprotein translocase subunit YajC
VLTGAVADPKAWRHAIGRRFRIGPETGPHRFVHQREAAADCVTIPTTACELQTSKKLREEFNVSQNTDRAKERLQRARSCLRCRSPILDMLCMIFAQAQTGSPGPMPGGGIGSFFVPLIFIFIIMYFVMIRPQKKRQEQQQKLVSSLKTGDRVVTNAGIHGLISNVKETTVLVKVADNVKIEIDKSAITNVLKEA